MKPTNIEHLAVMAKKIAPTGDPLPVMEHFYTLQGEGFHQGKAAYFVRLGGCNVGCHWCDVKESWDAAAHPLLSVADIVAATQAAPAEVVVITGGEPLIHPLDFLCAALHQAGKRTHIETSGSSPLSGAWDWICLSPKKFKAPLPEVLQAANELKVVVFNKSDFAWGRTTRPSSVARLHSLPPTRMEPSRTDDPIHRKLHQAASRVAHFAASA